MDHGDAKNIVKEGQVLPDIRLGNIGFQKVGEGMIFDGFFQKSG